MAMFYALCLFGDFIYIHVYAAFSKWGASVRLKLVKLFSPIPFFFICLKRALSYVSSICHFHAVRKEFNKCIFLEEIRSHECIVTAQLFNNRNVEGHHSVCSIANLMPLQCCGISADLMF